MKAIATFIPYDSNISGTVIFSQSKPNSVVKVSIDLKGFDTNEPRAIHIHEFGDISGGCMTAGGHYNPTNTTHGTRYIKGMERHAGDLCNNIVPNRKKVKYTYRDNMISLYGTESIIGRTIVIHEGQDDYGLGGIDQDGNICDKKIHKESLKTGNAGGRMTCAVIGIKK